MPPTRAELESGRRIAAGENQERERIHVETLSALPFPHVCRAETFAEKSEQTCARIFHSLSKSMCV